MERTWKPTTAGILSIISGAIEIFWGVAVVTAGGFVGRLGERWQDWINGLGGAWGPGIGIVILVFGVIALVGGIHAIRRKRYHLALAGSILAFPFLPFGGILGLLAIIFVSEGKREFD